MSIFHPFVWLFKQFKSLFNSIEKEFNKLLPEVQNALKDATGIMDYINKNIDEPGSVIAAGLDALFGNIGKDKLHEYLVTALHDADLVEGIIDTDFEKTISNLAKYLKGLEGLNWAKEIKDIRDLLAIAIDPQNTTWHIVQFFGEWVFVHWFKKSE